MSTYPKLMEQEIFRYIFVKLSKTDNLTDNNIKLLMALKNIERQNLIMMKKLKNYLKQLMPFMML